MDVTFPSMDCPCSGKHVLFCVGLGTPSHSVALFEIGRELQRRGHTFSYAGFKVRCIT